jgi:hypothetical protein
VEADGHDLPALIDEASPGTAAMIDDVGEGFEDTIGEPVLSREPPDIFLRV